MTQSADVVRASAPFSDQVADIVRRRILSGDYAAGQRLNEVDIATSLRISRSPVREGLRKLVDEGLVEQHPGRGVFVAGFEADKIQELLELREAFDVTGARLAALRATPEQLAEMAKHVDSRNSALAQDDPFPVDFHVLILRASGNSRLSDRGEEVHRQLRLARLRSGSSGARPAEATTEHQAILAAISSHDIAAADEAMRLHLRNASAQITRLTGSAV